MKNILLLSMSTLPAPGRLNRNEYVYRNDKGEAEFACFGYGQLEPVPKYLMWKLEKSGRKLDSIVILATKATRKQVDRREEEGIRDGDSAVDFFRNRTLLWAGERGLDQECYRENNRKYGLDWYRDYEQNHACSSAPYSVPAPLDSLCIPQDINILVVDLDTDHPAAGINHVVEFLRREKMEENINLFLDIHGGLRDSQLALEAILSLLKTEKIVPEATYTVRMGAAKPNTKEEKENRIEMVPSSSDIFGFVSGMSEFINYGRADSLRQYLGAGEALTKNIQNIANAIQLCDIDEFEKQLSLLKRQLELDECRKTAAFPQPDREETNSTAGFLDIFRKNIKNDYGAALLDESRRNAFELLRWCERKGFYQQALTIIESRMSEYICTHFVKLNYNEDEVTEAKRLQAKAWQAPLNFAFECCAFDTVVSSGYLKLEDEAGADHYWENEKIKPKWKGKKSKGRYITTRPWKADSSSKADTEIQMNCTQAFDSEEQRRFNIFLQLHMALKKERNLTNHAADEEREPAWRIFNAIKTYIEMAEHFNQIADTGR